MSRSGIDISEIRESNGARRRVANCKAKCARKVRFPHYKDTVGLILKTSKNLLLSRVIHELIPRQLVDLSKTFVVPIVIVFVNTIITTHNDISQ